MDPLLLKQPQWKNRFGDLVDRMVAGPGEAPLLEITGHRPDARFWLPDYDDLFRNKYLSPGPILPFSASDGCWWRRCAFCPERAERRPFRPLAHQTAVDQLLELTRRTRPALIHLLDNALSPAFAALKLTPWRLRVMPGEVLTQGKGEAQVWQR